LVVGRLTRFLARLARFGGGGGGVVRPSVGRGWSMGAGTTSWRPQLLQLWPSCSSLTLLWQRGQ